MEVLAKKKADIEAEAKRVSDIAEAKKNANLEI